mmetsp:Transcript_43016/g.97842  ORF Transcript_43016/g.97842 Transcript_43016/m.97842 type:complete len:216 (+) Transcript_43016:70-717(+)
MWGGGPDGGHPGAPMVPFHRQGAQYQQGHQMGLPQGTNQRPEDLGMLNVLHQSLVPQQALQVFLFDERQRRDMPVDHPGFTGMGQLHQMQFQSQAAHQYHMMQQPGRPEQQMAGGNFPQWGQMMPQEIVQVSAGKREWGPEVDGRALELERVLGCKGIGLVRAPAPHHSASPPALSRSLPRPHKNQISTSSALSRALPARHARRGVSHVAHPDAN